MGRSVLLWKNKTPRRFGIPRVNSRRSPPGGAWCLVQIFRQPNYVAPRPIAGAPYFQSEIVMSRIGMSGQYVSWPDKCLFRKRDRTSSCDAVGKCCTHVLHSPWGIIPSTPTLGLCYFFFLKKRRPYRNFHDASSPLESLELVPVLWMCNAVLVSECSYTIW